MDIQDSSSDDDVSSISERDDDGSNRSASSAKKVDPDPSVDETIRDKLSGLMGELDDVLNDFRHDLAKRPSVAL